MSAFTRQQKRFVCQGVQLTRALDNTDPSKFGILQNVRSYVQGEVQARLGLLNKGSVVGSAIHSLIQVQDPTPFAGTSPTRYIGAGTHVYAGPVNGPWPSIDSGYSGNPLTFTAATPPQSPQPWLYITDSSRMQKVNSNGTLVPIGIAQPTTEPTAALQQLGYQFIQQFFGTTPWTSVGSAAGTKMDVPGGRINTSISQILYDSGSTGNCSIVPVSMDGFDDGIILGLNEFSGGEIVVCYEVTIAVANTTIASIIYDSGTSGLCTIQPAASLGAGQVQVPSDLGPVEAGQSFRLPTTGQVVGIAAPFGQAGTPPVPSTSGGVPTLHQRDFPVNALVTLGGATETVRILSVATGADGVQSFRCATASTHNAGDGITGVAAFRTNTTQTYAATALLQEGAVENVITPVITQAATAGQLATGVATAGVQGTPATGFPGVNIAQINGRATLPDDDFHCSIRVDNLAEVTAVRVYLDVDATTNDFTENYYFFEWGANDIIAAIQVDNTNNVSTLQQVRYQTVINGQLGQPTLTPPPPGTTFIVTTPGGPTADGAVPSQLSLGNNQWLELRCKISDFIRVGTDPSRTLANVAAAEILVALSGTFPVTVQYDSLWVSGGYGPDVGNIGAAYLYCYRYRSSTTGARSNPSPATRGGVLPRRDAVLLTATGSTDPQSDLIDWYRIGGALTTWTYIGTCANAAGTVPFLDTISDSQAGGDTLDFTNFQPWPTQDLSRSGTCNVAGSAIRRVSGSSFNTAWAPGSPIIVNGLACSIYKVVSTTLLFINENAGSGSGVLFTLPGPTLTSQTFATWWGGAIGGATFYFSCGDTVNPGYALWTNGNDTETAGDANRLQVTTASEPLQNGFLYDGTSYVASTENIYALELTGTGVNATAFRPLITPAGRGFWTRWAFCVAPEGVYFLAKDGIYLSTGGAAAVCITDADLYPLFPHDGVAGVAVNGYAPVDMTQTTRLRLTFVSGWLYFDYLDTNGAARTLAYWTVDKSWWPDVYTPGVSTRWATQGQGTTVELIGGANGVLYTANGTTTDDGSTIACHFQWTDNQQDGRREKLYRDLMLECDLGGGLATVTLGVNNNQTLLTPQTLGPSGGRGEQFINAASQVGTFGRNLTFDVTWSPVVGGTPTVWYLWDAAYQLTPELASSWLSGPTTHGLPGFQQVYLALIAFRSFGPVNYSLIIDNVTYSYALNTTGGQYQKVPVVLQAVKGLSFQHGMTAQSEQSAFQMYSEDCEFWIQPWAMPGSYQKIKPF